MAKRTSPYVRLRRQALEMARKVVHPRRETTVLFLDAKNGTGDVRDLFWQADVADTLGFDLVLVANHVTGNLDVVLVERHGVTYIPHAFREK